MHESKMWHSMPHTDSNKNIEHKLDRIHTDRTEIEYLFVFGYIFSVSITLQIAIHVLTKKSNKNFVQNVTQFPNGFFFRESIIVWTWIK